MAEAERNPGWQMYMHNYCHRQKEDGVCRVIVTENGANKYDYTGATSFDDKRKPNLIYDNLL